MGERANMPGTKEGARKARETNLKRDPNFYAKIGKKGGEKEVPKGYSMNLRLASLSGKLGGRISRVNK